MSQDFNIDSKKSKRVTRAQRNRPVLVTSLATEQQEQLVEEMPPVEMEPITLVDTPPVPKGRIAGFFSTVGKGDQAKEINEAEIAKARLARASHGKMATSKTAVKEVPETEKNAVKPVASKTGVAKAQRPPSLFKPRYILGIVIYLAAANFLGTIERNFLISLGVERTLTQFNLFGLSIQVTPSGLTFIITLIIILVLLVRFDLLPTSLGAATGARAGTKGVATKSTSNRAASGGDGPKPLPPVLKSGVQGADDELYRTYRSKQRREKKR